MQIERAIAGRREVDEWFFEQLTGNTVERLSDQFLRAVRRAGVEDRPAIDDGLERIERLDDAVGFVLDDHDEPERRCTVVEDPCVMPRELA
jgi:ribosome assembly protein YihI (activator of Der GTPase)